MLAPLRVHAALAILCLVGLATSAAAADLTYSFNLPEQALVDTLRAIGRQTTMNIVFAPETVDDARSPAIRGDLTLEEAITRALGRTQLQAKQATANSILIERLATPSDNKHRFVHIEDGGSPTGADPAGQSAAQGASAAGEGAQDSSGSSEATVQLEEVLVTAEKRTERLLDTPVPVTAIPAQQLLDTNQLTLQDFYSTVPG